MIADLGGKGMRLLSIVLLISLFILSGCGGGGGGGGSEGDSDTDVSSGDSGGEGGGSNSDYSDHDFGGNDPHLYLAFGDSITYGYNPDNSSQQSYPDKLAKKLFTTVINEGWPGDTTYDAMRGVNQLLSDYKPGYLLILFGANDCIWWPWDVGGIINNLRYIIQSAKNNKTIPVIATLTPFLGPHDGGSWVHCVKDTNEGIRELAVEQDIPLADLDAAFNWSSRYMSSDGLHPNNAGYELIASIFYDTIILAVIDTTPPDNVTNVTALPGDSQVALSWTNPTNSDFAGVVIQRSTSGYPRSIYEGTNVYTGSGSSFTDTGVVYGTGYYYTIFSYDDVPNYSSGTSTSVILEFSSWQ